MVKTQKKQEVTLEIKKRQVRSASPLKKLRQCIQNVANGEAPRELQMPFIPLGKKKQLRSEKFAQKQKEDLRADIRPTMNYVYQGIKRTMNGPHCGLPHFYEKYHGMIPQLSLRELADIKRF